MKRIFSTVFCGAGLLAFALAANAQSSGQDPYYRSRNGYYGDYGNGQYQQSPVARVMSDLNRAAGSAYLDGHERHHFDEVARNLDEFQAKWARGKFDTGKLDRAIDNLKHLAEADRVNPRDREMLTRDIYDLRQFRETRGGYGYGPRYNPGWR